MCQIVIRWYRPQSSGCNLFFDFKGELYERGVYFAATAMRERTIMGGDMFTAKESTLLFEMNHRLRELHVKRAAAQRNGDHERAEELQFEIETLTRDCHILVDADDAI